MRLVVLVSFVALTLSLAGCAADSTGTSEEQLSSADEHAPSGAISGVAEANPSLAPSNPATTGAGERAEQPSVRVTHDVTGELDAPSTSFEGH